MTHLIYETMKLRQHLRKFRISADCGEFWIIFAAEWGFHRDFSIQQQMDQVVISCFFHFSGGIPIIEFYIHGANLPDPERSFLFSVFRLPDFATGTVSRWKVLQEARRRIRLRFRACLRQSPRHSWRFRRRRPDRPPLQA